MNNYKSRIALGFVVWAAMVSAVLIAMERTPLGLCAWVALLLAGLLSAASLWRFADGKRNEYLTNLLFPTLLLPGVVISALFSIIVCVLELCGYVMPVLWFVVIQVIILGVTAFKMLSAGAAQEAILKNEAKVKADTADWKSIRLEMDGIASIAPAGCGRQIKELQELIRYSDPVTNPGVAQLEDGIGKELAVLKHLMGEGDEEKIQAQCASILQSVNERNAKLKALK